MKFKCSRCFSPLLSEKALFETVAGFKNSPVCPGCFEGEEPEVKPFDHIGFEFKFIDGMKKKMMEELYRAMSPVFFKPSEYLKENPNAGRKTATEFTAQAEAGLDSDANAISPYYTQVYHDIKPIPSTNHTVESDYSWRNYQKLFSCDSD